jgi:hypothetical protein
MVFLAAQIDSKYFVKRGTYFSKSASGITWHEFDDYKTVR